jgi:hypothetical protein
MAKRPRKIKKFNSNRKIFSPLMNSSKYNVISSPDIFCIYDINVKDEAENRYVETVKFFSRIEGSKIDVINVLDFSDLRFISAAAILALYANISEKIKINHRFKLIKSVTDFASDVNSVLTFSGLIDLVNGRERKVRYNSAAPIPISEGVGKDKFDQIIDHLLLVIYKDKDSIDESEHVLSDAISETLINVSRHAYPGVENTNKKWWLLYSIISGKLYIVIYDLGVGMPRTIIANKEVRAKVLHESKNKALTDAQLIHLAMTGDFTGTNDNKHGQGSKSMKALIDEAAEGKLLVYSEKGYYQYKKSTENDKPDSERGVNDSQGIFNLDPSFNGTLIQWEIKV